MELKVLTAEDDPAYVQFLDKLSSQCDHVLGYHYPFYRDIIQQCGIGTPCFIGAFVRNELLAVVPGFVKSTKIGTCYCSMPFFGPNAGVMCLDQALSKEIHNSIIDYTVKQVEKMFNPIAISFYTPLFFDDFDLYDKNLSNSVFVEKHTQYLDIQRTEWSNKIRYDLRKAEKSGVTISESVTPEKLAILIDIYNENCADYGIPPKPRKFIERLGKSAADGRHLEIYFAYHEEEIIGGLIVIFSKTTLSYYLPCSRDSSRSLQAVTFMIDHAFKKAKGRGIKYWNWESSPDQESGVFKFKKKWGSVGSTYRVYAKLLCTMDYLKSLGREGIEREFPFFFVYPFNKI